MVMKYIFKLTKIASTESRAMTQDEGVYEDSEHFKPRDISMMTGAWTTTTMSSPLGSDASK